MNSKNKKVFVYGSLKKGFHNSYLLDKCDFLYEVKTNEKYLLFPNFDYSFPYLFKKDDLINYKDPKQIKGEIYEVDEKTLKMLDILEGVENGLYKREKIKLSTQEDTIEAYAYFANPSLLKEDLEVELVPSPLEEWTLKHASLGLMN